MFRAAFFLLVFALPFAISSACQDDPEEATKPEASAPKGATSTTVPAATPTGPTVTPEESCPELPIEGKPYKTPSPERVTYRSPDGRFSLAIPTEWTVCSPTSDPIPRDAISAVEFWDTEGLPRITVFVFANPDDLSLEDWIADHNPIFLDDPPQDFEIDGRPALHVIRRVEGSPSGAAYVLNGAEVLNVSGLKPDDFDLAVSEFAILR